MADLDNTPDFVAAQQPAIDVAGIAHQAVQVANSPSAGKGVNIPAVLQGLFGSSNGLNGTPEQAQAGIDSANKAINTTFAAAGTTIAAAAQQLQAATGQAQIAGGEAAGAGGQASAAIGEAQTLKQQSTAATEQSLLAKAAIETAKANSAAQANMQLQGQIATAKLGGADTDKLLSVLGDNVNDATAQAQKIHDMRQVSFLDDPGQWLYNNVIGIDLAQKRLAASTNAATDLQSNLNKQVGAIKDLSVVDTAINSSDTIQQAALVNKQFTQAALAAGADAQMKGLQLQLSGLGVKISAANAQTAAAGVGVQAADGLVRTGLAQGQNVLQQQAAELGPYTKEATILTNVARRDELVQKLNDQQEKDSATSLRNTLFTGAMRAFGLNPPPGLTPAGVNPKTAEAVTQMGLNMASSGGSIAFDPASALKLISQSQLPISSMPPGNQLAIQELTRVTQNAQQMVMQEQQKAGAQKLDEKGLETAITTRVRKMLIDSQTNIGQDSGALFAPPSLNLLINKYGKSNPVIAGMTPLIMDGSGKEVPNRQLSFNDVFDSANRMVESGQLSEQQAVGNITSLAKGNINDAALAYGMHMFAIPQVQDRYNVLVKNNGINPLGNSTSVNLLDAASVLSMMRQQRAGAKSSEMLRDMRSLGVMP